MRGHRPRLQRGTAFGFYAQSRTIARIRGESMFDLRGLRQKMAHFVGRVVYRTDKLLPKVVGHWQWTAPPWISWVGRKGSQFRSFLKADPKRAIALATVLA